MRVILKEDIKTLGKKGDIVEVSDGYARNYLLPRALVVEADEGTIKKTKEQKKGKEIRKKREKEEAQALAEKISKTTIIIKRKAGEDGQLYGSVTTKDIAQELQSQAKIKVDKRKINLAESIRYIGNINVNVKVHREVEASFTVKVEVAE